MEETGRAIAMLIDEARERRLPDWRPQALDDLAQLVEYCSAGGDVPMGSIVIVGPIGSGKSSLASALAVAAGSMGIAMGISDDHALGSAAKPESVWVGRSLGDVPRWADIKKARIVLASPPRGSECFRDIESALRQSGFEMPKQGLSELLLGRLEEARGGSTTFPTAALRRDAAPVVVRVAYGDHASNGQGFRTFAGGELARREALDISCEINHPAPPARRKPTRL